MEYKQIENLINEYKTEGNFSVTEIFDALHQNTFNISKEQQNELLEFIEDEIDDWNDFSDSEGEYDNKFHYTITVVGTKTLVNILSGNGKLTTHSTFILF